MVNRNGAVWVVGEIALLAIGLGVGAWFFLQAEYNSSTLASMAATAVTGVSTVIRKFIVRNC